MKVRFWDYVKAAFNARPIGMFVPPNWIGLAAIALLGVLNRGFWIMGAGLELGYLYVLSTHPRFQRWVRAEHLAGAQKEGQEKLQDLLAQLSEGDKQRYRGVERQCQGVIQQQGGGGASTELLTQGEGLGRLIWIFLRLLLTRQSIKKTLNESIEQEVKAEVLSGRRKVAPFVDGEDFGCELFREKIRTLEEKMKKDTVPEEVKKSLTGQVDILQQRLQSRKDALQKIAFLEAELDRIEEQVKLIREQATVAADPGAVSARIDQIAATLGGTTQWIKEQQRIYGQVQDLLEDPPPLVPSAPLKQAQKQ
jgi:hypothetical protein